MQNYLVRCPTPAQARGAGDPLPGLGRYEVYLPRLREHRRIRGRSVEVRPPLFPGYAFVLIVLQWNTARCSPGVATLIMDGGGRRGCPITSSRRSAPASVTA